MSEFKTKIYTEIGAGLGFITGALKGIDSYFDHFAKETWIRVVDGMVITTCTTIIGTLIALSVTLVFKKMFKDKKE